MNTEILMEAELVTDRRLRLFSLHVDFAAAMQARWATGQISRVAGVHWKSTTEMWDVDSLTAGEPIRKMITRNAAEADVLVVAMSSVDWREWELVQWLDSLAACQANRAGTGLFVGLLGDANNRAGELDWTVKQFLGCAQRMDRNFVWHWMAPEMMDDSEWLTDSVTALLTGKKLSRGPAFLQEMAFEGV
jgi:hypothetical protein